MKKSTALKIFIPSGIVLLLLFFALFPATQRSLLTTFVPFTGKLFDLNPEHPIMVQLQSGTTGQSITFTDPEQIREANDYLNGFRYVFWRPKLLATSGWSYRVSLGTLSYEFGENWIRVNNIIYYSAGGYFRQWTDLIRANDRAFIEAQKDAPPVSPTPFPASASDFPSSVPPGTGSDISR